MNRNHVIIASKSEVYTWGFRPSKSSYVESYIGKELVFHVDEATNFNNY